MKEYKLLKDIVEVPAGTIFRQITSKNDLPPDIDNIDTSMFYVPKGRWTPIIPQSWMDGNPEWFELVEEKKKYELSFITPFDVGTIVRHTYPRDPAHIMLNADLLSLCEYANKIIESHNELVTAFMELVRKQEHE